MYRTCYQFLFTALCVATVSCTPHGTNIDTSQAVPDAKKLSDNQSNRKQDQDNKMTIREKQKTLMLAQDYQGALDLMPQLEKELLEKAILEKEMFEKGILEENPVNMALRMIRHMYCYLYVALGRDEEALQKFMEIELPTHDDPDWVLLDNQVKILIMKRLNMLDGIIDETNTILNKPNIVPMLQVDSSQQYAMAMIGLIHAQLAKGDFESAQNNIYTFKDYLQRYPTHFNMVSQWHSTSSAYLSVAEYYVNNLTETHTACFVKCELVPITRDPNNPDRLNFDLPNIAYDFVSKTDGSLFTSDDLRAKLAESLLDPFQLSSEDDSPPPMPWVAPWELPLLPPERDSANDNIDE